VILAFADDSTVRVFDTLRQANTDCEAVDVMDGVYVFLDEAGHVLRPVFTRPPEIGRGFLFTTVSDGKFVLERTDGERNDLVRKLERGEIILEAGATAIRTLADLKLAAPMLFADQEKA
jgi:hypothetical protein